MFPRYSLGALQFTREAWRRVVMTERGAVVHDCWAEGKWPMLPTAQVSRVERCLEDQGAEEPGVSLDT